MSGSAMVYLSTLYQLQRLCNVMCCERMLDFDEIWNELGGNDRDLFRGTIVAFSGRDWDNEEAQSV